MKFGVIVFPGSNCDRDMQHVLSHVMGAEVQMLWHKDKDLSAFNQEDCIILPGGFSYGDYLRTGAIARFSPIMNSLSEFAQRGGLVFGICNGFQILCEAGLLPGALLMNNNRKYVCKNVFLKTISMNSAITNIVPVDQPLKIPIAHGEGRYFINAEGLAEMKKQDQILFAYCNEEGMISEEHNPNGSIENIAGVCNEARNVFGMMPHPERASEAELGNTDGRFLFESILQYRQVSV